MGPKEPVMPPASSKSDSVPMLACDSTNWIIWKSQTIATSLATCGAKQHLDGTAQVPPPIPTYPNGHVLTEKEEDQLDELEKC